MSPPTQVFVTDLTRTGFKSAALTAVPNNASTSSSELVIGYTATLAEQVAAAFIMMSLA
jgi:hypothetical protein